MKKPNALFVLIGLLSTSASAYAYSTKLSCSAPYDFGNGNKGEVSLQIKVPRFDATPDVVAALNLNGNYENQRLDLAGRAELPLNSVIRDDNMNFDLSNAEQRISWRQLSSLLHTQFPDEMPFPGEKLELRLNTKNEKIPFLVLKGIRMKSASGSVLHATIYLESLEGVKSFAYLNFGCLGESSSD